MSVRQKINKVLSKSVLMASVATIGFTPYAVMASEDEEQNERIDFLEETIDMLSEKVGSQSLVHAFNAKKFNIGGQIWTGYDHADGEAGDAQAVTKNVIDLLIKSQFTDQWSTFLSMSVVDVRFMGFSDPTQRTSPVFVGANGAFHIFGWGNYKHNDFFNVRFGRIVTPIGIYNTEHFPHSQYIVDIPLHIVGALGGQEEFYSIFTNGVEVHGNKFIGNNTFGYSIFAGIQDRTNLLKEMNGDTDDQVFSSENFIGGARLTYTIPSINSVFGISYIKGDRGYSAVGDTGYSIIGGDYQLDVGNFHLRAEVYSSKEDYGNDKFSYYVEPAYDVNKYVSFMYRYDFVDYGTNSPHDTIASVAGFDTGDLDEHTVGIQLKPIPQAKLRLTHHMRTYHEGTLLLGSAPEADVDITRFTATFAF